MIEKKNRWMKLDENDEAYIEWCGNAFSVN